MHKMGPWASGLRKLVAQAQDLGLQAHEEAWGDHDGPGRMRSGPWASSP